MVFPDFVLLAPEAEMDYAYTVDCSPLAEKAIARSYLEALQEGNADWLVQAGRAVEKRLKWGPADFGEPLLRTVEHGEVRVAVHERLAVHFAVDAAKHKVLIRSFQLLTKPAKL